MSTQASTVPAPDAAAQAAAAQAVKGASHGAAATGSSAAHGAVSHAAVTTHAATIHTVPAPAPHLSLATEIQNFAYNWQPVLMILFFTAIIVVLWRTLKVMPRTKPQQIKPASNQAVTFDAVSYTHLTLPTILRV